MIPGSANPLLLKSAAAAGPVQIERSLRFNSSDSGFCSRTPGTASNRKTWTWAAWVKRTVKNTATDQMLFTGGTTNSDTGFLALDFNSSDKLRLSSAATNFLISTAVYRDPGAWMHIVLAFDATQGTNANKVKLYVNSTEVTVFDTDGRSSISNQDYGVNQAAAHEIGRASLGSNKYLDGYLADVHFIDGQALTPSSFTEVSATTGQLIPLAYSGSFGTNGFWLKFSDNSAATAAALGNDYSGNNNDWTPNNLSVTAGAGNDSLVDTPTSIAATDTGVGGEVRGNYCTINPNDINNGASVDLKDGNLEYVVSAAGQHGCRRSTFALSSSKWYAECTIKVATGGTDRIGILSASQADFVTNSNPSLGFFSQGYAYMSNGQKENNNVSVSYGASYTTNDVIGIALDMDAGTVTFYKNGSSQGQAYSGLSGAFCFAGSPFNGGTHVWNFGQRAFAYTAPSGFKALCDTNLGAPLVAKPNTLMDVALWSGNGGSQTITLPGAFSPNFVWIKRRSSAFSSLLYDTVRGNGPNTGLISDSTTAEGSASDNATYGYLNAFNSTGFALTAGSSSDYVNTSGQTYVGWAWDAGEGSAVSNGSGSITSQVRANVSAGFSVVTYTASAGATIGHGLGIAPSLIIAKSRTNGSGTWAVYSSVLGRSQYLLLNATDAAGTLSNYWGTSDPTSTVFGVYSTTAAANNTGDMVAYCFAPVVGYSSFGSYTGNGSADGPFIYTGFRPKWVMIKLTSNSGSGWQIHDTSRNTYNVMNNRLQPSNSDAESTYTTSDFLSNGFKLRDSDASWNGNGSTFIYAAFAENPFQYARAR